jgi:hypothetical protein
MFIRGLLEWAQEPGDMTPEQIARALIAAGFSLVLSVWLLHENIPTTFLARWACDERGWFMGECGRALESVLGRPAVVAPVLWVILGTLVAWSSSPRAPWFLFAVGAMCAAALLSLRLYWWLPGLPTHVVIWAIESLATAWLAGALTALGAATVMHRFGAARNRLVSRPGNAPKGRDFRNVSQEVPAGGATGIDGRCEKVPGTLVR